jgi:hypothetical protein
MWSGRSTWGGGPIRYGQKAFGDLLETRTFGIGAIDRI